MHNRAERKCTVTVGSTKDHVGPGTYDIHLITDFDAAYGDNIVPFNSSALRELTVPDTKLPFNYYSLPDTWDKAKSTQFSLYHAQRFPEVRPVAPSVGTYNLSQLIGRKILDQQPVKEKCPLVVCPSRAPQPPSIPPRRCCGYVQGEDGQMRALPIHEPDQTLGPAFYHLPEGEIHLTTHLYKGCSWSRRTSIRGDEPYPGLSPGPGYYSFDAPLPRHTLYFEKRILCVPRFPDDQVILEMKRGKVDPGSYYPYSQEFCVNRFPRLSAAFSSKIKRFRRMPSRSPGPAYYHPRFPKTKPMAPVIGTRSARFQQRPSHLTVCPAPTLYTIPGFVEKLRKKLKRSSVYDVFGSSTERRFEHFAISPNPGPCDYDVKIPKKRRSAVISSPVSKPQPGKRKRVDETVYPEPGDHELSRATDYLYRKTSHRKSKKGDCVGFLVGKERFRKPEVAGARRLVRCSTRCPYETPGPATYNVPPVEWVKPSHPPTTCTERFPPPPLKQEPEPATYKLHPSYLHTILKPSFNATLSSKLPRRLGYKWRPPRSQKRKPN